jgi:hypothetical protein
MKAGTDIGVKGIVAVSSLAANGPVRASVVLVTLLMLRPGIGSGKNDGRKSFVTNQFVGGSMPLRGAHESRLLLGKVWAWAGAAASRLTPAVRASSERRSAFINEKVKWLVKQSYVIDVSTTSKVV